jgi:hypothetical protein
MLAEFCITSIETLICCSKHIEKLIKSDQRNEQLVKPRK